MPPSGHRKRLASVALALAIALLVPGEAAAVILGALVTIVVSSVAGGRAALRQARAPETPIAAS